LKEAYDGKKVLVFGGSGFIGSRLIEELVSLKAKVFLIEDNQSSFWRLDTIMNNVEYFSTESWEYEDILKILDQINPEIVFNLRAVLQRNDGNTNDLKKFNIDQAQNLLRAIEKKSVDTCIHIGTIAEYGDNIESLTERSPTIPSCNYGQSKLETSLWLKDFIASNDFPAVIIRLSVVYGPKQNLHDYLIPKVIKQCLLEEDFEIPSSGMQKRDPLYIDDAIEALLIAGMEKEAIGEIFNIGLGDPFTVKEIANVINRKLGCPIDIHTKSDMESSLSSCKDRWHDISKANEILSWQPKYSLEEGIVKTLVWYDNNRKILGIN
jgi:nucleoside-diphosphate-sugar epimerase